jgi:bifunctional non-homologous end joining protein LigD
VASRCHASGHEALRVGRPGAGRPGQFTEWTSDGQLRQPVFLGLRSDKDPKEVVRE